MCSIGPVLLYLVPGCTTAPTKVHQIFIRRNSRKCVIGGVSTLIHAAMLPSVVDCQRAMRKIKLDMQLGYPRAIEKKVGLNMPSVGSAPMCTYPENWVNREELFREGFKAVFLANVNSRSRSLYAISRPSVVCLLSVVCCLSVCDIGAPYSGGWTFRQFFSPYDSSGTLLFWCQKSLVGDAPFPLKFAFKVTHPL